jgi:hypothetical protein
MCEVHFALSARSGEAAWPPARSETRGTQRPYSWVLCPYDGEGTSSAPENLRGSDMRMQRSAASRHFRTAMKWDSA